MDSPPAAGSTTLYHVAILYPTRQSLADARRRLIAAGIPLDGASDHGVSEALYLRDPDQNGIELYWTDRRLSGHPRLHPYLQGVIAAIGSMFGEATGVAIWYSTTGLSDRELASPGFRRIAGSGLIYRHSALRSEFTDDHPAGMDILLDFEAEESDAEWVLREWNNVKSEE